MKIMHNQGRLKQSYTNMITGLMCLNLFFNACIFVGAKGVSKWSIPWLHSWLFSFHFLIFSIPPISQSHFNDLYKMMLYLPNLLWWMMISTYRPCILESDRTYLIENVIILQTGQHLDDERIGRFSPNQIIHIQIPSYHHQYIIPLYKW